MVKSTYRNVLESEIRAYRDRYKMQGISLQNWMALNNDYSTVGIGYYDSDMAEMENAETSSKTME